MTICESIGKFQTTIHRHSMFGKSTQEVEFDITWVSCGWYSITVSRLNKPESDNEKTNFIIHFTPEWFVKVIELYPDAEKRQRMECYKPFHEEYVPDLGMFDMGHDTLLQAFKDQFDENVILTNYHFERGVPRSVEVLNIRFDEFKRLKEYLDNPNGRGSEIFYSGVQFA
jgi:hypothetical protein